MILISIFCKFKILLWFKNNLSNLILLYNNKLSCLKILIKTIIFNTLKLFEFVKEQRVYGSYTGIPVLRCTLMGFERNYQVNILSNQKNKKTYSTLILKPKLNPWVITGLADSEGSFIISLQTSDSTNTKWKVKPSFSLTFHKKDIEILEKILNTLGVVKLRIKGNTNRVEYIVESFKDLPIIIEQFDSYPLITAKSSDYKLFKKCFEIITKKEHLTEEGLKEIVSLKSSLNWGLSDKLKEAFPTVNAAARPEFKFKDIPNPFWVSGFTTGDGSFNIVTRASKHKKGFRVELNYSILLHIREKEVIIGLADFFGLKISKSVEASATYIKYKYIYISDKSVQIKISNFLDIENKIIPFFDKYTLEGTKRLDFEDYKKAFKLIKSKEHLNLEGFTQILKIKAEMNDNRNV